MNLLLEKIPQDILKEMVKCLPDESLLRLSTTSSFFKQITNDEFKNRKIQIRDFYFKDNNTVFKITKEGSLSEYEYKRPDTVINKFEKIKGIREGLIVLDIAIFRMIDGTLWYAREDNNPIKIEELSNIKLITKSSNPNDNKIYYLTKEGKVGRLSYNDNSYTITSYNQLENIIQIAVGEKHEVFLNDKGEVFSYGSNEFGQCLSTDGPEFIDSPAKFNINSIVQIAAGCSHTVALGKNGDVYVAGRNIYGQLGIPGRAHIVREAQKIPNLPKIVKIATGDYSSLFIDDDDKVYGCGSTFNNTEATFFSKKPPIQKIENGYPYNWLLYRNHTLEEFNPYPENDECMLHSI